MLFQFGIQDITPAAVARVLGKYLVIRDEHQLNNCLLYYYNVSCMGHRTVSLNKQSKDSLLKRLFCVAGAEK